MKKNNWLYKVFLLTFLLAAIFSAVTTVITNNFNNLMLFIILLIVVAIGIIFDMIGVSILTSKESTFHAMASQKIKGSKESIYLIKNAVKLSSICNDVIGDICGIVSGGLGTVLTINVCTALSLPNTITSIIVTSVISAVTVGSKAVGKTIAAKKCDKIVFIVGKIMNFCKLNKK